jgi:hypothetical protein
MSAPSAQPADDLLNRLRSLSVAADNHVAALRVEKWKADAQSKQQTTADALSIRRNLGYAMPELIVKLQAAPGSLAANFRLYRNLDALYDAFSSLAESAGAFAPRDQFSPLGEDLAQMAQLRHQLADRVETLSAAGDAELTRLHSLGTSPKAPSRIVVDDNQPAAKRKSKPAPTQPAPASTQ